MKDATTWFDVDLRVPTMLEVPGGTVAAFSSRGPGKDLNEDAAAVLHLDDGVMLCVADGMGGHQAGERAARLAIEMLVGGFDAPDLAPRHALFDAVEAANQAVLDLGVGAGATLAVFLVRGARVRSLHVGDAAAVHVSQRGTVKGWTSAHSPTGYAVEAGLLDEEEALHHEDRHIVSNCLGMPDMRIEIAAPLEVAPRDTLLVASDGLLDNILPEELVDLVRSGNLEASAASLVSLVSERMASPRPGVPSKPDDLTFLLYRRER